MNNSDMDLIKKAIERFNNLIKEIDVIENIVKKSYDIVKENKDEEAIKLAENTLKSIERQRDGLKKEIQKCNKMLNERI